MISSLKQKRLRAAVIGYPVKQSRSPMIHQYWLEKCGIDGSYEAIEVHPDNADTFFEDLKDSDLAGVNVTIPHKERALAAADRLDPAAKLIGAVNTIWREGEQLVGGNTDWIGFSKNLTEFAPNWKETTKSALVLGAGGASRGILFALLDANVEKITLANRTLSRAVTLQEIFGQKITPISLDEANDCVGSADLIINTTSLGMEGEPPLPLDITKAKSSAIVTDIVYKPLETPILKLAREHGLKTVDGLGMLLHQAAPGFEKWFDQKVEVTPDLRSLILKDLGY